ncbi:MAG: SUMF1/EgtB/PvdO family nonheme iron enzyme [Rhodospirillales bacterium]
MANTSVYILKEELRRAREHTDNLFRLLNPEALYDRPIPERHRLIFYLGHLEAFDWNLVCRWELGMSSFHPTFDKLFAFGIDPPEGSAPADSPSDWPQVDEVVSYNQRVRQTLDDAIERAPETLLHVAIEHRWMHAETFAYLMHNLPPAAKIARPERRRASSVPPAPEMVEIPAGTASLGMPRGQNFGWDNEFDAHKVQTPGFAIGKYKVTNGEYLKYVRAGGEAPHFWVKRGDAWFWRGMFEEIPLPLDWPVYVTQRQAESYAAWVGKNLPTEKQFHRAAYGTPSGEERAYPWGSGDPGAVRGNFNFAGWDPEPVNATPETDSAFGVSQLVGNGWEWTSTVFEPFPGFKPFPFYPGYSANFFDNCHYVMKGASPRTASALLRRSFRNWFRPNYPYVYAGFRVAEN